MSVYSCPECGWVTECYPNCPIKEAIMIRECKVCKDKYRGNPENWGHEEEKGIIVCFYCYSGEQDRKWTPEWSANK